MHVHTFTLIHIHAHTPTQTHANTHNTVVGDNIHEPRREVDQKLAASYAKNHHMSYIEVSGKTREGVDDAFYTLVREIRHWVSLYNVGRGY